MLQNGIKLQVRNSIISMKSWPPKVFPVGEESNHHTFRPDVSPTTQRIFAQAMTTSR